MPSSGMKGSVYCPSIPSLATMFSTTYGFSLPRFGSLVPKLKPSRLDSSSQAADWSSPVCRLFVFPENHFPESRFKTAVGNRATSAGPEGISSRPQLLKGICLVQKRRQAMRMTLVSVLAVLAHCGVLGNAQQQSGALPAWPSPTNGYVAHPPTNRLFFFMSDPKDIGGPAATKSILRPSVFGRPAQAPDTGGFRSYSITNLVFQNPVHPTLRIPPTGLLPLQSPQPQKPLVRQA